MDKHIADRWVQALRSGQYKQGKSALHPNRESYCCLGVLCDLYRVEQGKGEWDDLGTFEVPGRGIVAVWRETATLPLTVMQWAGIQEPAGDIAGSSESLAELNDEGMGFPELANLIEKKWEVL